MEQKTCGNYVLVDRIAKGGMAEVYLGRTSGVFGVDRLVAVKMLLPMRAESKQSVAMFIDEARLAVELSHVNIVQIFELGVSEERYYIAMEYVPGADLAEITRRVRKTGERMPIAHAVYVAYCVCAALDYAHTRLGTDGAPLNIVHRDVSPQNVLIGDEGGVKVTDFGIALSNMRLTQTVGTKLKGKVSYMSPEQAWGRKLDPRSDLFSVGTILYQILTGEVPFDGKSELDVVYKVRECQVTPPRELRPDIPEELEAIVLRALRQDPNERFATAESMHAALEPFLLIDGRPFGARDLREFVRRLRADEAEEQRRHLDDLLAAGDGAVAIDSAPADWSEIDVTQIVEMELAESAILAVHQPWAAETGLRSVDDEAPALTRSVTRNMPRMPTREIEELLGAVGPDLFADHADVETTGVEVVTGHERASPQVPVPTGDDGDDEEWTVPDTEHRWDAPAVEPEETEETAEPEPVVAPEPRRSRLPVVAAAVAVVAVVGLLAVVGDWSEEPPASPTSVESPLAVSPERVVDAADSADEEDAPASTRVEAVRLRRGLASLMRARGLSRGDSAELDELLERLSVAVDDEHWSQAYAHAEAAMTLASDLEVSARMVRGKIARMARRAEQAEDEHIRESLEVAILEGRALLDEGEIEDANQRLHEAIVAGFAAARSAAGDGDVEPTEDAVAEPAVETEDAPIVER